MTRIVLLLVMTFAAAGWRPVEQADIARVMAMRPPDSQAVAEQAAEEFVRQQLGYPPNAVFTFRPVIRSFLGKAGEPDAAYVGIWMCGTVRVGSTANTAVWLVNFDRRQPNLVHDGGTSFERSGRFNLQWCQELYRDGVNVYSRK